MAAQELKEELRTEFVKVWGQNEKMVNYCVNKASQIIKLSGGQLYVIDKEKLETHFPCGYSTCGQGQECEDAVKEMRSVHSNTDIFRERNTRDLKEMIEDLQPTQPDYCGIPRNEPYIRVQYRTGSPNIYDLAWVRDYQLQYEQWRFRDWEGFQPLSDEDRATLIAAYQAELDKRNKQIDAYIKRYGTSKLRTWTYWVDE